MLRAASRRRRRVVCVLSDVGRRWRWRRAVGKVFAGFSHTPDCARARSRCSCVCVHSASRAQPLIGHLGAFKCVPNVISVFVHICARPPPLTTTLRVLVFRHQQPAASASARTRCCSGLVWSVTVCAVCTRICFSFTRWRRRCGGGGCMVHGTLVTTTTTTPLVVSTNNPDNKAVVERRRSTTTWTVAA